MNVIITDKPFDPWAKVGEFQHSSPLLTQGGYGATAVFVGTMRNLNEGDGVETMTLEHYPGMTEKHLTDIIAAAKAEWDLLECLIVHRVGTLGPDDPIVLAVAWSAHRAEAFTACRFLMEELKSRAPFWKKETLTGGDERWVEHNTPG